MLVRRVLLFARMLLDLELTSELPLRDADRFSRVVLRDTTPAVVHHHDLLPSTHHLRMLSSREHMCF